MATNYTYHILASNMAGTVWSGEKSFETLPFGTGTNFWTGEGITDDWFEHANWIVGVPLAGEHVIITNIGKEVLLTNDTVALASFTITNETLTFTNWNTTLNASDVTIQAGGTLTIPGAFTESQMSNRVYIVCSDFTLENGGVIDVDTNGYAGGQGTGKGGSQGSIGGGGGRIAVWYRVPESERQRILDGDMKRVSIITNASDYSDFSGTVSVTNGIGPYGPEYNGELGTVVFLTLTPPSGMVFMCQ